MQDVVYRYDESTEKEAVYKIETNLGEFARCESYEQARSLLSDADSEYGVKWTQIEKIERKEANGNQGSDNQGEGISHDYVMPCTSVRIT